MFWTIVFALLFVFVGIPFILAVLGEIVRDFRELDHDLTEGIYRLRQRVLGSDRLRRRPRTGLGRRVGRRA